jgi:hypothetical protein
MAAKKKALAPRPTLAELRKRGVKTVSRGGQHEVLCDGSLHWTTDHRYRPTETKYIQGHSQPCWCPKPPLVETPLNVTRARLVESELALPLGRITVPAASTSEEQPAAR